MRGWGELRYVSQLYSSLIRSVWAALHVSTSRCRVIHVDQHVFRVHVKSRVVRACRACMLTSWAKKTLKSQAMRSGLGYLDCWTSSRVQQVISRRSKTWAHHSLHAAASASFWLGTPTSKSLFMCVVCPIKIQNTIALVFWPNLPQRSQRHVVRCHWRFDHHTIWPTEFDSKQRRDSISMSYVFYVLVRYRHML